MVSNVAELPGDINKAKKVPQPQLTIDAHGTIPIMVPGDLAEGWKKQLKKLTARSGDEGKGWNYWSMYHDLRAESRRTGPLVATRVEAIRKLFCYLLMCIPQVSLYQY